MASFHVHVRDYFQLGHTGMTDISVQSFLSKSR